MKIATNLFRLTCADFGSSCIEFNQMQSTSFVVTHAVVSLGCCQLHNQKCIESETLLSAVNEGGGFVHSSPGKLFLFLVEANELEIV